MMFLTILYKIVLVEGAVNKPLPFFSPIAIVHIDDGCTLPLHHALFAPEPSPLLPQRNPTSDTELPPGLSAVNLRNLSSVSTVTLRASGGDFFKGSHHSEPLLDPGSQEATTAFLDIPIISARNLNHPPDPGPGWLNGPRFERDFSRQSNRRWPLDGIWRRLRRLKLLYALAYTLIGAGSPIHRDFPLLIITHSCLGDLQHHSILPIFLWLFLSAEANHLALSGHLYDSLCCCSRFLPSASRPEPLRPRHPFQPV
jgi:hypothetical protein